MHLVGSLCGLSLSCSSVVRRFQPLIFGSNFITFFWFCLFVLTFNLQIIIMYDISRCYIFISDFYFLGFWPFHVPSAAVQIEFWMNNNAWDSALLGTVNRLSCIASPPHRFVMDGLIYKLSLELHSYSWLRHTATCRWFSNLFSLRNFFIVSRIVCALSTKVQTIMCGKRVQDTSQHSAPVRICNIHSRNKSKSWRKAQINPNFIGWSYLLCAQRWNWIFLISYIPYGSLCLHLCAIFAQWLVPLVKQNKWMCDPALAHTPLLRLVVIVVWPANKRKKKTNNNNRESILLITCFTHHTRTDHILWYEVRLPEQPTWNIFICCLKGTHSLYRCSIYHSTWQSVRKRRCKCVACQHQCDTAVRISLRKQTQSYWK